MGSAILHVKDEFPYDDDDDDIHQLQFHMEECYDPAGQQRVRNIYDWEDSNGSLMKWDLKNRKTLSPLIHDRVLFFQYHKRHHEKNLTSEALLKQFPRYNEESLMNYYDCFMSHFNLFSRGLATMRDMCRAFEMLGDLTRSPLRITILMCCWDNCRYFHVEKFIKLCVFMEETLGKRTGMYQCVRRLVKWCRMAWGLTSMQYYPFTRGC